jgi:hypothetical protein
MAPLIISFYTRSTPYEEEVKKLVRSCEQWGLETDIEAVESQGSWGKNCALKPSFILKKAQQHQRPVLWVDADGVFKQRPDFKEFAQCDLAVRVNEFLPEDHPSRIVSNTVFVNAVPQSMDVVRRWRDLAEKEIENKMRIMEFWDQTALRDALKGEKQLRFLPMPLKYSKIFDFDDLFIAEGEVVIEHYQASRRHKEHVYQACQNHCCH